MSTAPTEFDLIVIGAGPGGYVGAIRAAQLGLKVACVEREPLLGGTCLRIGCIPSKALLESSERFYEAQHTFAAHGIKLPEVQLDLPTMLGRKDNVVATLCRGIEGLFKKNKITRLTGHARFTGPGSISVEHAGSAAEYRAKFILIATGSRVGSLPGVAIDGQRVTSSTEALAYPTVPKTLIVIGAGFIGLELGSVWRRLGSQVTVLEYLDRILPGADAEIAAEALKLFKKQGLEFQLGTRVLSAKADGDGAVVEIADKPALRAERVLVSVGRVPNTEGLGLDAIGVQLDHKGRIPVDKHYATKAPGVFAIGDVIEGPMLAHKAEEEAVACVEQLVTGYGHVNYDVIPSVAYTHPEVASVGRTEEQLQTAGVAYRKGKFMFRANGRALAMGDADGMVKILSDAQTDRILGVHMLGPRVGDLIAEAATAMEFGASSEDLARTCHAHPTLPEATKEAALAVLGRVISS
ncbi:MAG: dihydrolipoyl dehydrogenase [Planctomycetes bacterium]|nr:dihydrolipoyl dehydrogenase [Planctomycetota bacterium]